MYQSFEYLWKLNWSFIFVLIMSCFLMIRTSRCPIKNGPLYIPMISLWIFTCLRFSRFFEDSSFHSPQRSMFFVYVNTIYYFSKTRSKWMVQDEHLCKTMFCWTYNTIVMSKTFFLFSSTRNIGHQIIYFWNRWIMYFELITLNWMKNVRFT
jgi:hypothetical protein